MAGQHQTKAEWEETRMGMSQITAFFKKHISTCSKELLFGLLCWSILLVMTSGIEPQKLPIIQGVFLTILISILGCSLITTGISLNSPRNGKSHPRELLFIEKIVGSTKKKKLVAFLALLSILTTLILCGFLLPKTESARYVLTALLGFSSIFFWEFMCMYITPKKH